MSVVIFLNLRKCEKKISGMRISLEALIQQVADLERTEFLDWIQRQRVANDDSIYWWMNQIAGRNNAYSMLFVHWVQIVSLRGWISRNLDDKAHIIIVCEDSFLVRTVKKNLKDLVFIESPKSVYFYNVVDICYYALRALHTIVRQIGFFFCHYLAARKTKTVSREIKIKGDVVLVHLCLDDEGLASDRPLTSRYFGALPTYLEQKGYRVVRLPWFFDISIPLRQVYKKIRETDCLVPEDWINFVDYPIAICRHLKSSLSLDLRDTAKNGRHRAPYDPRDNGTG